MNGHIRLENGPPEKQAVFNLRLGAASTERIFALDLHLPEETGRIHLTGVVTRTSRFPTLAWLAGGRGTQPGQNPSQAGSRLAAPRFSATAILPEGQAGRPASSSGDS